MEKKLCANMCRSWHIIERTHSLRIGAILMRQFDLSKFSLKFYLEKIYLYVMDVRRRMARMTETGRCFNVSWPFLSIFYSCILAHSVSGYV